MSVVGTPTVRENEIGCEVNRMRGNLESVEEGLKVLGDRFSSVLSQPSPECGKPEETKRISPLSVDLQEFNERLRCIISGIVGLRERCEL